MYYLFVINMPPSTLIQSVVSKPSKRKDVFYEMSSTCPVCKLKCSRKDVMLRHKRNKHGTTHAYPQSSDAYPPLREGYTPQLPPPLREGYAPQQPPPQQQPYSQSNEEVENPSLSGDSHTISNT
jgi:hypothetical protein